ncbi:MAG: flagellar filament capping protein FliD [Gammaproteobacteria bacterium]|nr:flagellar filament capping protein FliD [Gammaproteobacteria bacterium]
MLTANGIGSGIDIDGLVSQLMALESRPVTRLQTKKAEITLEISNTGKLRSSMASLANSAKLLTDPDALNAYSSSSSDKEVLTVSTTSAANAAGSYEVVVDHLAQANRYRSAAQADAETAVGTGTLTLTVGDKNLELLVDNDNNTLSGLRDAINNHPDNPGVNATVMVGDDGARLLLSASDTGLANAVSVSADAGLSALAMTETTPALDSQVTIDGITVTSANDRITGAIDGVDLALVAAGTATISVKSDASAFETQVKQLVSSYNNMRNEFAGLRAGSFDGASMLLSVESSLRNILFTPRGDSNGAVRNPSDIGIEFNDTGNLTFDAEKLQSALASNRSAVVDFLSNSETGLATAMQSYLESYSDSDGVLDARVDSLNNSIKNLDQRIENAEFRLTKTEARLRQQFTTMDKLVARMQTTSNFLLQQFSNNNNQTNG